MAAFVGTGGWSIPAKNRDAFAGEGSALQRYASRFAGVEINSSFHRPHSRATWERWAGSVPDAFRFAAKLPKTITHGRKLVDCDELLDAFLGEVGGLGGKLAVLLVQLPPKLAFDEAVVAQFLDTLLARSTARVACEPRNASWFEAPAERLLEQCRVARVGADPAVVPAAGLPGSWGALSYWRLHGSPEVYRSAYDAARIERYAELIEAEVTAGREVWCMFDNTARSEATGNALALLTRLDGAALDRG